MMHRVRYKGKYVLSVWDSLVDSPIARFQVLREHYDRVVAVRILVEAPFETVHPTLLAHEEQRDLELANDRVREILPFILVHISDTFIFKLAPSLRDAINLTVRATPSHHAPSLFTLGCSSPSASPHERA